MAGWTDRLKQRVKGLKEDEGRRGLLPWLSVDVQKWSLVGVAGMGAIVVIVAAVRGNAVIAVLVALATGFLCYVGIRTRWLANIDTVNSATRISAGVIVVAGLLAGTTFLAIVVAMIVLWGIIWFIIGIFVFAMFGGDLLGAFFGDRQRGEIKGDIGETIGETRTIRPKLFGKGSDLISASGIKVGDIQEAWLSDDQIIRASDGSEIGRICRHAWRKDVQEILGRDGDKVGEIRTDFAGHREIVDDAGDHVGFIEKDWLGRTTINRD